MEGLSKETVFTSWMAKFDCILKGKNTCYDFYSHVKRKVVTNNNENVFSSSAVTLYFIFCSDIHEKIVQCWLDCDYHKVK